MCKQRYDGLSQRPGLHIVIFDEIDDDNCKERGTVVSNCMYPYPLAVSLTATLPSRCT